MNDQIKYGIFLILLLASCSPKYYSPNTQNVPLITQKAETNLTLAGNSNQIEFQGAYGVSDAVSVMLNGGLFIPAELDNGNGGSGRFIELGGGYFRKIQDHWAFESYVLMGFGGFENHLPSTIAANPTTTGDIAGDVFRIGIQPAFGYKSKYLDAAVSSRIVNLSYKNIHGDLIFEQVDQAAYLQEHANYWLFEPAFTFRAGFEKFKVQLQYVYSINASDPDFRQDKTNLTLGLNFNFD
ncbi:MAG TPA: hypothetical protein PLU49_04435 [Saprospiraceae bacterium]|nr:hypothetical protein [Saprospirales bacterium]HRQ29298.1 hypothetical protein [Saprospiraceae bacterium]